MTAQLILNTPSKRFPDRTYADLGWEIQDDLSIVEAGRYAIVGYTRHPDGFKVLWVSRAVDLATFNEYKYYSFSSPYDSREFTTPGLHTKVYIALNQDDSDVRPHGLSESPIKSIKALLDGSEHGQYPSRFPVEFPKPNVPDYRHITVQGSNKLHFDDLQVLLKEVGMSQDPVRLYIWGTGGSSYCVSILLSLLHDRFLRGIPDVLVAAHNCQSALADLFILYRGRRHILPEVRFMFHMGTVGAELPYRKNMLEVPVDMAIHYDPELDDNTESLLGMSSEEKSCYQNTELWLTGREVAERLNNYWRASCSDPFAVTTGLYVQFPSFPVPPSSDMQNEQKNHD